MWRRYLKVPVKKQQDDLCKTVTSTDVSRLKFNQEFKNVAENVDFVSLKVMIVKGFDVDFKNIHKIFIWCFK